MVKRSGGCNCGRVRFEAEGEPVRTGVCHCQICRRETGSAFNVFAVWPAGRVSVVGETRSWLATTLRNHFCPTCGSPLFCIVEGSDEVEIRVGSLDDAPSGLVPAYELWLPRREHWLTPVDGAEQHAGDRA